MALPRSLVPVTALVVLAAWAQAASVNTTAIDKAGNTSGQVILVSLPPVFCPCQ
jgi:hypothetical protein